MGIKFSGEKVLSKLIKSQLAAAEKALEEEVSDHTTQMVKQAHAGRDFENKKYPAYSPGYERKRKARGYSTKPNLTVTGNMLSAINYKTERKKDTFSATMFVANTSSAPPRGFGKGATSAPDKIDNNRKWARNPFGLSATQFARMAKRVFKKLTSNR